WLEIRSTAQRLLTVVERRKEEAEVWLASLPDAALLISDVQAAYQKAVEEAQRGVAEQMDSLKLIEKALTVKVKDPSATPAEPSWVSLATSLSSTVLSE